MNLIKRYTSILLTTAVLAIFIWYGLTHKEIFSDLTSIALWAMALIVIGKLINIWTTGIFTKWTVEAFTDTLGHKESFVVAVLTAIGNILGPLFGGLGIRAVYLKKFHNLDYSKFTATLIGYYLIMFLFNSLLAIAGILLLPANNQTGFLLLVFGGWFVAFFVLMFFKLPKRERLAKLERNKILRIIIKITYDIEAGWRLMISNRVLLIQMLVLAVANLAALYFVNYIEFVALGITVTPAAMMLYTAIVQASMLLSITPGAVGLREAVLLVLAGTLGITNAEIVQVAILDRGIWFVLLAVLFVIIRLPMFRREMKQASQAETQAQTARV